MDYFTCCQIEFSDILLMITEGRGMRFEEKKNIFCNALYTAQLVLTVIVVRTEIEAVVVSRKYFDELHVYILDWECT